MEIQVGGIYKSRKGNVVQITSELKYISRFEHEWADVERISQPFHDAGGNSYTRDGYYQMFEGSDYDLVEEVK